MWSRRLRPSAIADRELDHDRKVALGQLPREVRTAFSALWRLDLAFADIVATSSDPGLGAIRMAWWREQLEELDRGNRVPVEPRLQAAASELISRGVSGKDLSQLEDAWLPLLEPFPWADLQKDGLKLRGSILFGTGARLLGEEGEGAKAAGAIWSLLDAAHHCSDVKSREFLNEEARSLLREAKPRLPKRVRPLSVLTTLVAADLASGGNRLNRLVAAIRHSFFGTFPKN